MPKGWAMFKAANNVEEAQVAIWADSVVAVTPLDANTFMLYLSGNDQCVPVSADDMAAVLDELNRNGLQL